MKTRSFVAVALLSTLSFATAACSEPASDGDGVESAGGNLTSPGALQECDPGNDECRDSLILARLLTTRGVVLTGLEAEGEVVVLDQYMTGWITKRGIVKLKVEEKGASDLAVTVSLIPARPDPYDTDDDADRPGPSDGFDGLVRIFTVTIRNGAILETKVAVMMAG